MNVNLNNDQQPPPVAFGVCGSMASLPDSQGLAGISEDERGIAGNRGEIAGNSGE